MKKTLKAIDDGIGRIESGVCIVTVIIISVIATIQIVLRYIFAKTIPWGEEVIQALMVWMVMFGAARATRFGGHTEMDGAVLAMPKYLRVLLLAITTLLTLGFIAIFFVSSLQLTMKASMQKSVMLRIPMPFMYVSMPIGGLFMIYEFVKTIKARIMKGRT